MRTDKFRRKCRRRRCHHQRSVDSDSWKTCSGEKEKFLFFTFFKKISHFSRFLFLLPSNNNSNNNSNEKKKSIGLFFSVRGRAPMWQPFLEAAAGADESGHLWPRDVEGGKKSLKKNDFRTKKSYIEYGIQFIQFCFLFPLSFFKTFSLYVYECVDKLGKTR